MNDVKTIHGKNGHDQIIHATKIKKSVHAWDAWFDHEDWVAGGSVE